jgi:hypothetical protein
MLEKLPVFVDGTVWPDSDIRSACFCARKETSRDDSCSNALPRLFYEKLEHVPKSLEAIYQSNNFSGDPSLKSTVRTPILLEFRNGNQNENE